MRDTGYVVPKPVESVEKVGLGADLFALTAPCCANQRGRRNATDGGSHDYSEEAGKKIHSYSCRRCRLELLVRPGDHLPRKPRLHGVFPVIHPARANIDRLPVAPPSGPDYTGEA